MRLELKRMASKPFVGEGFEVFSDGDKIGSVFALLSYADTWMAVSIGGTIVISESKESCRCLFESKIAAAKELARSLK